VEYTVPQFTKAQVDKAGAVLTNPKAWTMAWDIDSALDVSSDGSRIGERLQKVQNEAQTFEI
jgi:hypothetical protein